MNRVLGLVMLLTVVPRIAGGDEPAATIRGKWEVTSATFNGTRFTGPNGRTLAIGEDEVTMYDGELPIRASAYTTDATTDPKQIDLDAGDESKKALGIYALGKDELKICYGEPGAERPAKFESKPGSRVFLLVLKRVTE
jgi:uncharacterized protein (TIGR03067 family)